MKTYSKPKNKGKFNNFRRRHKEQDGKNLSKKWQHDKFKEKGKTLNPEHDQSFNGQSRHRYTHKKTKTIFAGKQNGRTRKLMFECMDWTLCVFENCETHELERKVNLFLQTLGIKFHDKTFFLFKIRVFFELKEMKFRAFDQNQYFMILDQFEKTYMSPIK
jgi:hypothetical protein